MPIRDEVLSKPENRFLGVMSDLTFAGAVRLLRQFAGQSSWHLVVKKNDGTWWVGRFSEIVSRFAGNEVELLGMRLEDLKEMEGLFEARAAETAEMGSGAVEEIARSSSGQALIVTESGHLKGVIGVPTTRGSVTDVGLEKLQTLLPREADLEQNQDKLLAAPFLWRAGLPAS